MKQFGLVLLLFFCSNHATAQSGNVFENLTLTSKILNSERKFAVYLPPDYETSDRTYPILYLLHGHTDDQTAWIQFGEVHRIADKAINEGTATSMIIVMPDADTGIAGYFNTIDGNWRYEDFFFEEFMPHVEERFRIKKSRRYRAIAGLSMGGGGSLVYAMRHPELFSSSCPMSIWMRANSVQTLKEEMELYKIPYEGKDLQSYLNTNYALNLIDSIPIEKLNSVRWYIDCGDDDYLFEENSLLHIKMKKLGVNHEFRIRDGAHSWSYWRTSLPKVLGFVSDYYHQY